MEKIKLDLTDRKILAELDKNCRIHNSVLAKKVHKSREAVKYRIQQLQKNGIIRNFITSIDPNKLGYYMFKIYLKLENIPDEEIDSVIDIDLKGMIYVTKLLLKHFKEEDKEAIILNISSRSGISAQGGQAIYTAAKWGVTGFTEVLKVDLKDTKIRVATVFQGGTNTEMFRKTGENFKQEKFIKPEDLANVILFMLSRPPQIWLHDVRVEY